MSRDYSIEIILNAIPTPETIKQILLQGQKLTIEYVDQNSTEPLTDITKRLTLDEATQRILLGLNDREDIDNLPVLAIKINETYCWLVFEKSNTYTSLLLGPYAYIWMKNSGTKQIDFDKYIRLLLDLCQDFCIVELKTLDSYRDGIA